MVKTIHNAKTLDFILISSMGVISRLINTRVHCFCLVFSHYFSSRCLLEDDDVEWNLFWKTNIAFIVIEFSEHDE